MAKFGTFKFGQAKFGTKPINPFPPNLTYKGIPLGKEVRRSIEKKVTYRVCKGHQFKTAYKKPTNPQTPAQQAWRATFTPGVAAAKALSEEEKEPYREIAKREKGQTWFTMFMRKYLWEASHGA
ncbi:MAG: hypothetical protein KAX15_07225 [Candidatus Omnitrophica bacterium]|nr:hypothetical protein [Candidatus Omnitrophota bacterium]